MHVVGVYSVGMNDMSVCSVCLHSMGMLSLRVHGVDVPGTGVLKM